MAMPITQQKMLLDFAAVQASLAMLVRDIEGGSIYAKQSAAFRDLQRWAAKAEKVRQGLQEMRL